MVEVGETISETLKREFCEEALSSLEDTDKERKCKSSQIQEFFAYGIEVRVLHPVGTQYDVMCHSWNQKRKNNENKPDNKS
jgi:hypothetical protein